MSQTIAEKLEINTAEIMNYFMEQLFNEKETLFYSKERVNSYGLFLRVMSLIDMDWVNLEKIERLISTIEKRFPKKLANESIEDLIWVSALPHSRRSFEVQFWSLPYETRAMAIKTIQENYPNFYRVIQSRNF